MAAWMAASGTNVVAGVTPGKGGQDADGVPVFNTVADARMSFPDIRTSCIVVPGAHVLGAVQEAVAAGITLVHVITERVPVHDVLAMRRLAAGAGAQLLGPSSVGFLQFPAFRLGYLGGQNPFAALKEGGVAVLSCSGGMANETLMALARQGTGVRLVMAVGGDAIAGTSLLEAVRIAEAHPGVTGLALFVEPGNALLRGLADGTITVSKSVVICLPGDALADLPRGMPYGHAGTVLGEEDERPAELRARLAAKGVRATSHHDEFIRWCTVL